MGPVILALFMVFIVVMMMVMVIRTIHIQHEGQIGLIESWGRFSRVVVPGRYILWPWEQFAGQLPLQIFEYTTEPQRLVLKGGSSLTLSAIIYFQLAHASSTPGAPRPARIMGTEPAPVGTTTVAGYGAAPGTAMATSPRRGVGIDPLEPMTRTQAQRRAMPMATALPRGTTAAIRRILGRNDTKLDIFRAAYRARYLVADWREASRREAIATLQQVFSKVSAADDIFGDVDWQATLGERVREQLTEKTERWGVQIVDVAFKDVTFADITLQNMFAEPRAEREGRIRTKEAENYKRIAELLGLSPSQLLNWRQVEIMRDLAKSPQPRVMFTNPLATPADAASAAPQGTPTGMLDSGATAPQPQLNPGNAPQNLGMPPAAGSLTVPPMHDLDRQ